MSTKTPSVSGGLLYDPAAPGGPIRLDGPGWRAWLEAPTTSRFSYPLFDPAVGYIVGVMTVRKERRQRGGAYWTAYRRTGDRVGKVYLGRSAAVTEVRLQEAADALRARASQAARAP